MAGGRPTKWKDDFARMGREMTERGFTIEDVAATIGVSLATVKNWMQKYPEFLAALNSGRENHDAAVERSLRERATGYETTETRAMVVDGSIQTVTVPKRYPPDPTSMIFWLKNRQPQRWRDKQDIDVSGTVQISFDKDDEAL